MKTMIDVKDRKEAAAIQRGLARPDVRAFVITCGILDTLPSDQARRRVMQYVADYVNDGEEAARRRAGVSNEVL